MYRLKLLMRSAQVTPKVRGRVGVRHHCAQVTITISPLIGRRGYWWSSYQRRLLRQRGSTLHIRHV